MTVTSKILAAMALLTGSASSVMFFVARADWTARDCARWPEAGQCHVAVGAQWTYGPVAFGSALIVLMLFWMGRNA